MPKPNLTGANDGCCPKPGRRRDNRLDDSTVQVLLRCGEDLASIERLQVRLQLSDYDSGTASDDESTLFPPALAAPLVDIIHNEELARAHTSKAKSVHTMGADRRVADAEKKEMC